MLAIWYAFWDLLQWGSSTPAPHVRAADPRNFRVPAENRRFAVASAVRFRVAAETRRFKVEA